MALLDAGTYRAKAVEGRLGETKTGKEQVAVQFQLLDADPVQTLVWYGYFTDKTTESTFKALRVAGWKGQDLSDLSDLTKETPEVHLVVEHELGQDGVTRPRVRWVNSAGGVGIKNAMAGDKAKAFAARMRGAIAKFDQVTKGAAPAPKKKAPAVPQEVLDAQENDHGEAPF
jgi:hypothetical protein